MKIFTLIRNIHGGDVLRGKNLPQRTFNAIDLIVIAIGRNDSLLKIKRKLSISIIFSLLYDLSIISLCNFSLEFGEFDYSRNKQLL
jgi:hypothetical protein